MRTLLLAFALISAIPFATASAADSPLQPNIVFILTDDLGINDLACYGRREHHTPHLDKLAADGVRFTSAYCAQPICSPSRAAILSGKHPARLHITTFLPGRADANSQKLLHPKISMQLPLEEQTLAERLKAAGYVTGCVGKWHLGNAGFGPKEQGFDVAQGGAANTQPSDTEGGKGEYALTAAAEKFIEENQSKQFFLHLCHNTPHIPLGAKAELVKKNAAAYNPVYAGMMETMDDCVGRVLAKLDALKLAEKTIVVFTSDNGGLHVLESPDSPATHNTPFRAGKGFVYEGGLRIPLIVRWPKQFPAGKVVDTPMVNTDWTPTLLAACGLEAPQGLDGVNMLGVLRGEAAAPRQFWWHFPHYNNQGGRPAGAIRDGDWKFVKHYDDGKAELYNLADDPGETRDLAPSEPAKTAALDARLTELRKSVNAQENTPNPSFDEAAYRKLYVDVDVSRLKPEPTAAETKAKWQAWREGMNAAIRGAGKKADQKKPDAKKAEPK